MLASTCGLRSLIAVFSRLKSPNRSYIPVGAVSFSGAIVTSVVAACSGFSAKTSPRDSAYFCCCSRVGSGASASVNSGRVSPRCVRPFCCSANTPRLASKSAVSLSRSALSVSNLVPSFGRASKSPSVPASASFFCAAAIFLS